MAVRRLQLAVSYMALALTLPGMAMAQQPLPVYTGDTSLYMHRDGSLTADRPTAGDDAVFTFDMSTLSVRFESPRLLQPWALRGPGSLHLTFRTTLDVLGRVNATLDLDGVSFADSTTFDLLPDFRPRDVVLAFEGLDGVLPVGGRLGLTISLEPGVQVLPGPDGAAVTLADVLVEMLYDSLGSSSGLEVLGTDGTGGDDGTGGAPGQPGQPGPRGPAGTSPGNTTIPGNNTGGGGGGGGGSGGGNGLPVPLEALATAGVDPFLVMAGIGTSAVAVLTGLAIRGRQGL